MLINFFIRHPLWALLFHVLLGALTRFFPAALTAYFVIVAQLGVAEIIRYRDKGHIAAHYFFYLVGLEILYRVGKAYLLWEMGKYLCIEVAFFALLSQPKRQFKGYPFVFYLLLILPGVFVSLYYGHSDPTYLRKLILQNVSGPLALGMMGIYFYQKVFSLQQVRQLMQLAVLPIFALTTFLFLGPSLSEVEFYSASNFATSGGYGPNQVSTLLGWGMFLLIFGLLTRQVITLNRGVDIAILALFTFRGLLTFSRGGMIAAVASVILGFLAAALFSASYRKKIAGLSSRLILGAVLILAVAYQVNQLTGNFLFGRYLGKSTSEIQGVAAGPKKRFLSNREVVMQREWQAFSEHPILGIGAGRGTLYRLENFGEFVSSHTEQTRLLGEHGLPGVLIILLIFISLPIYFFFQVKGGLMKQWVAQFAIFAMLTMFHAAMRLSIAALIFSAAFILIVPEEKEMEKP